MGRYDDVGPDALRTHLLRLAKLILRLDREGSLLREAPRLQNVLGDLRQRLFAYEVRSTSRLGDQEGTDAEGERPSKTDDRDALIDESLRIVRKAIERDDELRQELDETDDEQELDA